MSAAYSTVIFGVFPLSVIRAYDVRIYNTDIQLIYDSHLAFELNTI
jgi:hypothetical protein